MPGPVNNLLGKELSPLPILHGGKLRPRGMGCLRLTCRAAVDPGLSDSKPPLKATLWRICFVFRITQMMSVLKVLLQNK